MPVCRILEHFGSAEGWEVGQEVDITNPERLIIEGKVEIVKEEPKPKKVKKSKPKKKAKK